MGGRVDGLIARLRPRLASPRVARFAVILSVLAVASSLGAGLAADDHFHALSLGSDPRWAAIHEPWWKLFTFYDGDPARTKLYVELGLSAWWTDPHLVASFFRPVSAATHLADSRLWPGTPWLLHLHSIAWYAVLVYLAARVYGRLFADHARSSGAWVAGLAAVLFGLDHNHAMCVGWVANRNALVAGVFAIACVGAHHLAVRDPSRRVAWTLGSAASFALALGSGESGLGAAGYLAAHALFLDERPWARRALTFVPHVVVGAAWVALYRAGGFGVRGSGMYLEPLREPAELGLSVLRHLPLLVASELGGPTPDVYPFLPVEGRVALVVVALLFLAWSARAIARLWRAEPLTRFFLVGSALAALPACAVVPAARLLTIASFGLIGLVALVGAGVADGASWTTPRSKLVRSFALWACGGHLVLSPLIMQLTTGQMGRIGGFLDGLAAQVPAGPGDRDRRLVVMNAPDALLVAYVLLPRQIAGEPVPARMLTLASGTRDVEIVRVDASTVHVRVPGGFYRGATEVVTRHDPMPVGSVVSLGDVTVEVIHTCEDGVPDEARFRFAPSADADAFIWQRWEGTRLVTVKPPPVGEQLVIPGQLPPVL